MKPKEQSKLMQSKLILPGLVTIFALIILALVLAWKGVSN